ncbi:MAG: hypothetical protein ACK5T0_03640 [Vampirovibrionales bacterium]
MTNIQRLKTSTIQNGLLINADDFNVELDQLINKANELDDAVYQNKTFTGNKTFNGTTAFQQDVTVNGNLNLSGNRQMIQWAGTETGATKHIFEVSPSYAPTPLPDGYTVSFKINETPDPWQPLSVKIGTNTALPLLKKGGQPVAGHAVVHGETITVQKIDTAFYQVGGAALPLGYVNTPVPQYVSARTISVNGDAVARSANTLRDLGVTGNNTVSLDVSGVNGLSPTAVLSPNTWYYLYMIDSGTTVSGGYLLHNAQGVQTFTIATVVFHARQLPLAMKTDGSSNLLPFFVEQWNGRHASIRYATTFNGIGSPSTMQTLVGLISGGTYVTTSLSAYVPPTSSIASLFVTARGGGGGWWRLPSASSEFSWDLSGGSFSRELIVTLNSSQAIDFKVSVNGFDVAVSGFRFSV